MGMKVYFLWVINLRGAGSVVKIAVEDLVVPSPKLNTWAKLGISFCSLHDAELTNMQLRFNCLTVLYTRFVLLNFSP